MKVEDLYTDLFGLKIFRVGNAAGTVRNSKEVEELVICESVGLIVVGSYTKEFRPGNPGQVFYTDPLDRFSVNANGLPNPGVDKCRKFLPEMVKIAHNAQLNPKLLIVSVVGFSPQEYADLAQLAFDSGADGVKLNLGCPNVWQDGQQKRIPCFDIGLIYEILDTVERVVGPEANILVKLSPCCDDEQMEIMNEVLKNQDLVNEIRMPSLLSYQLEEMAKFLASFTSVKAVVSINTLPNVCALDENGRSRITFGEGLGGLGGSIVKKIGLNQVARLRKLLPERIKIIGCGGISTGQNVIDYWDAGAALVEVGTAYLEKGVKAFDDIMWQLADLIDE